MSLSTEAVQVLKTTMKNIASKYTDYANKVLNGEIPACEYIKLACKRYLSFFERDDMYFDAKSVDKVDNFCSKLKHSTGAFAGKPFKLVDWQYFCVCAIYGFKWKKNGLRVCRKAYLELGRKNGKSTLIGALALFHLIGDGEGNAQVVCAANSAKQAQLLFDMSKLFIKPFLATGSKIFRTYRDSIIFDATNSKMEVVAADASKLDGKNCSFFVCDELHAAPNSSVWDVLETSQGMREQPLAIAITTAGFNRSGFCYQMRQTFVDILSGALVEDSSFCAIYTIDENDDPYTMDRDVWKKANPNLGVTVREDYIEQQLNNSRNNTALQTSVLTKLFNKWLNSHTEWISQDYVIKAQKKWEFTQFDDMTWSWMGIDLAAVSDLTCVSVMVEDEGTYYFRNHYFLPSEQLEVSRNRQLYRQWANKGFVNVVPGNVTDYDYVDTVVRKINDEMPIQDIAYDPWNSTSFITKLTQEAFQCTPFQQTIGNFNRPTKEFERLILSGKAVLYPNPIDNWCFGNVAIKTDYNENARPIKGGNEDCKIDGVVAMLVCLGNHLQKTNPFDYSVSEIPT